MRFVSETARADYWEAKYHQAVSQLIYSQTVPPSLLRRLFMWPSMARNWSKSLWQMRPF